MTNLSLTSFGLGFPAQHPSVKTVLNTGNRQQKVSTPPRLPTALLSRPARAYLLAEKDGCLRLAQTALLGFRVRLLGG